MADVNLHDLISNLFRKESGKMAAVLTRLLGFENLGIAEDIVQDTLLKAATIWKYKGIPENPSAWLYTVAKRQAIDVIRQRKFRLGIHEEINRSLQSEWTLSPTVNQFFLETEIEDSQLRMIFACCHPAIPYESQIALTLKTLCGLSISEIANSFLTTEETITKRIYRAREKIRDEKISVEVPTGKELQPRIEAVLHTLYLLFNEGYNSSKPGNLIRHDLCEEAIRLTLLLTRHPLTNKPESNALLSLLCFQASRENARLSYQGEIILLQDQDRSLWNKELIAKGIEYLNRATETDAVNEYQIEAAIGACHAVALDFDSTDWTRIFQLYESLERFKPGPIVRMNKAIALSFCTSAREGLDELLKIQELKDHYLFQTTLGDLYQKINDKEKALFHYDRAIAVVNSNYERELLIRKKEALG